MEDKIQEAKEALEKSKEKLEDLKKTCETALVKNTKALAKVFCNMDEKDQLREMGQARIAISSMESIIGIMQSLTDDEKRALIDTNEKMAKIFIHAVAYLELGLVFGYTEKAKKEEK